MRACACMQARFCGDMAGVLMCTLNLYHKPKKTDDEMFVLYKKDQETVTEKKKCPKKTNKVSCFMLHGVRVCVHACAGLHELHVCMRTCVYVCVRRHINHSLHFVAMLFVATTKKMMTEKNR